MTTRALARGAAAVLAMAALAAGAPALARKATDDVVRPSFASYAVELEDCHDGDTCTFHFVLADLEAAAGLGVTHQSRIVLRSQPVRLCDLDAPELSEPGGAKARDAIRAWLRAARQLEVRLVQKPACSGFSCERRDKYGRWLGYVVADEADVGARLLKEGLAVPYPRCR